ncbi:MAG: hypothetical protein QM783_01950 [Phycisphaerales bacterium]
MKRLLSKLLIPAAVALAAPATATFAQVTSAFTYNGKLAGAVSDGSVDMRFTLWNAATGGTQIGSTLRFDGTSGGGNQSPVTVKNGVFSVPLDFGDASINNGARWIDVEVRSPHDATNTAPYVAAITRQRLSVTPMATFSRDTAGFTVNAANQLMLGTGGTYTGALNFVNNNLYLNGEYQGVIPAYTNVTFPGVNGKVSGLMKYTNFPAGFWRANNAAFPVGRTSGADVSISGPAVNDMNIGVNGHVGIGLPPTDPLAAQLTVAGAVRSTAGGLVFPDGTVQTTALPFSMTYNAGTEVVDQEMTRVVVQDVWYTTHLSQSFTPALSQQLTGVRFHTGPAIPANTTADLVVWSGDGESGPEVVHLMDVPVPASGANAWVTMAIPLEVAPALVAGNRYTFGIICTGGGSGGSLGYHYMSSAYYGGGQMVQFPTFCVTFQTLMTSGGTPHTANLNGNVTMSSFPGSRGIVAYQFNSGRATRQYVSTNFSYPPDETVTLNLPAGRAVFNWTSTCYSTGNGMDMQSRLKIDGLAPGVQSYTGPVSNFEFSFHNKHMTQSGSCTFDIPVGGPMSVCLQNASADNLPLCTDSNDNVNWTITVYRR